MDYRILLALMTIIFAIFPIALFLRVKRLIRVKKIFVILAIFYILIVCVGVFTNVSLGKVITIKPFNDLGNANKPFNWEIISKKNTDFVINILMLVPLGFLLGPTFERFAIIKSVAICASFSIIIECMQLVLPIGRNPQLNDIILNTLSGLIGVICFYLLKLLRNIIIKIKKKHSF